MKHGIQSVTELREYLEGTTDNGAVTVNRGLLRQLLVAADLLQEMVDDYDDTGCDGCGVIDNDIRTKAERLLGGFQ